MQNKLKTYTIYQVYIRNFTQEGTFKALINRLDYIKDLGVKIIQLLPINEIGENGRKGKLGSPYAIKDYYAINHELGTLNDFKELIKEAHKKDLLIMMDVVFNHTSRDSLLLRTHPEYFYKDKKGNFANRFGDWSDVYDLDYHNLGLIEYVTKVLEYYTTLGVDGYRFDVASLLPNEVYQFAFPRLRKLNPNLILLGEAVEVNFANSIRRAEGNCDSDCELYIDGFNLLYRYSNYFYLKKYFETYDKRYLEFYKVGLYTENATNPSNALKIGTIENHDCPRIANLTKYDPMRGSIIAFSFFLKGTGFIYNGEECKAFHQPTLFDKDTIDMKISDINYFNFVKKMVQLKANPKNLTLVQTDVLNIVGKTIGLKNVFEDGTYLYGLFNFDVDPAIVISEDLENGDYVDLITNEKFIIKDHTIKLNQPLYLKKIND